MSTHVDCIIKTNLTGEDVSPFQDELHAFCKTVQYELGFKIVDVYNDDSAKDHLCPHDETWFEETHLHKYHGETDPEHWMNRVEKLGEEHPNIIEVVFLFCY